MASFNLSLPGPMKDWVESQASSGRYSDASEYVQDLIRRDQERHVELDQLQSLIDEGLKSGLSDLSATEILAIARAEAEADRR